MTQKNNENLKYKYQKIYIKSKEKEKKKQEMARKDLFFFGGGRTNSIKINVCQILWLLVPFYTLVYMYDCLYM